MTSISGPIRDWPEGERPRERLIRYGPGALSDAQLLSLILETGDSSGASALDLSRSLLNRFGSFRALDGAGIAELCETRGIGPAKAARIAAALEIGKRLFASAGVRGSPIRTSSDVSSLYLPIMRNLKKEVFKCVLLDAKNRVIKDLTISEGSLTASIVHPREVFLPAIRESAASIILIHNHPSGDPTPSAEDIDITRQLVRAGEMLGIRVLDHVIIGDGRSVSFADQGML